MHLPAFAAFVASAALCSLSYAAPPKHISKIASTASPSGVAVAWCEGKVSGNHENVWSAVAVAREADGGIYVVHHASKSIQLGRFSGTPEVQCMSVAQARKLNGSIGQSEGIHGGVELSGNGPVVCVFVEPTKTECWQYSARKSSFIRAGGWST
jgi:hypothetical protein